MSNKSKRRTSPVIGRRGFITAASLAGAAALAPPVVAEAAPIAPAPNHNAAAPPTQVAEATSGEVELAIRNLVIANRILARENVVDAYGHVSLRHPLNPEHYLLSRSRSPDQVEIGDIVEYTLDGEPINDKRPPYIERFIHGGIYRARPDVHAVVHAHSEEVLPFSISPTKLRPVIHDGAFIGAEVPVWDIADKFGSDTDLLVSNMAEGRDLARRLGRNSMVLMRGHGFAAAAPSLYEVVRLAVYAPKNAHVFQAALLLGNSVKPLSKGEIAARVSGPSLKPGTPAAARAWEYWARRAGVADLLPPRPGK
ncbi:MAG TPA: class II aldolase/adducin family protein [Stellaceae bacterium]|nr:class II aldolase/adducin family protein [Stellaceae bacterium]